MKKIILDGYNVIHKIPDLYALLKAGLEGSREGLTQYLVSWTRKNEFAGHVYIVFDGKSGMGNSTPAAHAGVRFIFTPTGQTADDSIIAMVKNEKDPNCITVISDDNYVITECNFHGAKVKSVQDFAADLPSQKGGAQKNIDKSDEKEINEFLKEKWGL